MYGDDNEHLTEPPGGYEFDFFVSYKHGPLTPWIEKVVNHLTFWMEQDLEREVSGVFFDTESMRVGDPWPDRLRRAILTSRCLVPFLTPQYFRCEWCVFEWNSFLARQRLVSSRIIAPLTLHDGRWFPPAAQGIQTLDLTRLVGTFPAFWKSERAEELDRELQAFGPRLADMVKRAPPFDADWPLDTSEPGSPPTHWQREGL